MSNQLFVYLLDKISSKHVNEHREKYNKWLKDTGAQVIPCSSVATEENTYLDYFITYQDIIRK